MQWLWILPSLAFGGYLYISTGQPTGLIFAGFSAIALLGSSLLGGRREPVDPRGQVHLTHPASGSWRVAIGNRVLPRSQWRWQAGWVGRVYEELESQNALQRSRLELVHRLEGSLSARRENSLQAWLGFAGSQEVLIDLPTEGAHGLIIGATGTGKSQLLATWLVSLMQGYSPQQLRLWLIDYKGGATLAPFSSTDWVERFATNTDATTDASAVHLIALLVDEMGRREALLAANSVGRIEDLPELGRPPRILLAIDEAQALLVDLSTHQPLQALAARGRSLGIHLLLTGQSLTGIPRALITNLGARFYLGKADPVELAQLGYQRAVGPGERFETVGAVAPLDGWGAATLITPSKQLTFSFPSGGKVGAERLLGGVEPIIEKVFSEASGPFGDEKRPSSAESVVIPNNTFDFSIGIEKQLQLTAEIGHS